MTVSRTEAEEAIKTLIRYIGDNPERPGLQETPARVVRAIDELFSGAKISNDEIAVSHGKCFTDGASEDMVLVRNIPCFSFCEHHMMLMYDMSISIAYLPKGKILGLSKFARIAHDVCARLQVQERIGTDIADIITKVTGSEDVAVIIRAKHSCMTARGIKADGDGYTITNTLRGKFRSNAPLRAEVLSVLHN